MAHSALHRAGLMASLLAPTGQGDPLKESRRRSRRPARGSMRKATRRPWNEKERARRARQIERGQLREENGLVSR